jgi:ABC-type multidrug transport system ATPase subunit
MRIELKQIGKRFNREWIFRDADFVFEENSKTAVLGPNGSGKSTLLQIISGILSPTKGEVNYLLNNRIITVDEVFQHLTISAPYLELIEELSLQELIDFHFSFKKIDQRLKTKDLLSILMMEQFAGKQIKYFSSGMKQRLKLLLALCSDVPLILLDEPTSNLDAQGIQWYHELIKNYSPGKTLIICSNQEHEYNFCEKKLDIRDYKQKL